MLTTTRRTRRVRSLRGTCGSVGIASTRRRCRTTRTTRRWSCCWWTAATAAVFASGCEVRERARGGRLASESQISLRLRGWRTEGSPSRGRTGAMGHCQGMQSFELTSTQCVAARLWPGQGPVGPATGRPTRRRVRAGGELLEVPDVHSAAVQPGHAGAELEPRDVINFLL